MTPAFPFVRVPPWNCALPLTVTRELANADTNSSPEVSVRLPTRQVGADPHLSGSGLRDLDRGEGATVMTSDVGGPVEDDRPAGGQVPVHGQVRAERVRRVAQRQRSARGDRDRAIRVERPRGHRQRAVDREGRQHVKGGRRRRRRRCDRDVRERARRRKRLGAGLVEDHGPRDGA